MPEVVESIHCPNCGGPLELKPGEVIVTCAFCASDINMATRSKYFLKHSIIPGQYDEGTITEAVRRWMGTGFLKPADLARKARITEMQQRYLPFFVVEVEARSKYTGVFTRYGGSIPKEGDLSNRYFWKILGRRGSEFPTKEYEIPLRGKVGFDLSRISPGARFLNAELDETEAVTMAKKEVQEHHRYLLGSEVDVIQTLDTAFEVKSTEFVHAPVWYVRYEYGQKNYDLILDGASGNFIKGDIPTADDVSNKGFMGGLKKGLFGGR